jgi:hypothetical protein
MTCPLSELPTSGWEFLWPELRAVKVECLLDGLIELGWLDPDRRGDRDAVRSAVIRLAVRALTLRVGPDQ